MLESSSERPESTAKATLPTVSFAIEKIAECEIHEYTNGNWLIIARGEKRTERKFGNIRKLTTLKGSLTLTLSIGSVTGLSLESLKPPRNHGSSPKKDGRRSNGEIEKSKNPKK